MSVKEQINQLVESLPDAEARRVLIFVRAVAHALETRPGGATMFEETGGDPHTIGRALTEDDPLWGLVGIVEHGPADLAENHDEHLADAYADSGDH